VTVPREHLSATTPAPRNRLWQRGTRHRPAGIDSSPDSHQTKLLETTEHSQARSHESSMKHTEIFQMANVGTTTPGRPRPLPNHRHAQPTTPSTTKSPFTSPQP